MSNAVINPETIILSKGAHNASSGEACIMELASFLACEPWSDSPKCASKVITKFLQHWNDRLDTESRQALKPYARRVIGTKGTQAQERARAWMCADWMVRTALPIWLDLAKLGEFAAQLRACPELVDVGTRTAALAIVKAAHNTIPPSPWSRIAAAYAADAAYAAAAAYAYADAAAAYADAAAAAYADAAADAAAADAAAAAAVRAALQPTVVLIQQSAFALLDRLIAVTG